ncbi:hypothetical protein MA4S0726RB_2633 [Mycobacteroides abscessus 4S-0726-RB]|nr:hypothetical protein MA4S0303_3110 [Mycobacteroides abscessus 4S-0303]EIT91304.1 hypothetical protein MA4S0726RB_2633 [Mycobacteroides abscessus 4S-0726-RB]EIT94853.1 hypothetical protein MA4S0726RA_3043 [Mycobacteroides abscessus 4S-0726-RA]EIV48252.1 hypothetical protein MA4S0116R_3085 [Mycobacteroides abscessus 4S-0116-R]EIV59286.1 hypothetical protein MA4S0116S_2181 [Mycobacteroides abscessus 4S-0116-S]
MDRRDVEDEVLDGDDPRVIEAAEFVETRSRELNRRLG